MRRGEGRSVGRAPRYTSSIIFIINVRNAYWVPDRMDFRERACRPPLGTTSATWKARKSIRETMVIERTCLEEKEMGTRRNNEWMELVNRV